MRQEAIDCETAFADDLLAGGIAGLSVLEVPQYLEFIADQRLTTLGLAKQCGSKNPFPLMDLQDVHELANFFERVYVAFDAAFSLLAGMRRVRGDASVAANLFSLLGNSRRTTRGPFGMSDALRRTARSSAGA